MIINTFKYTKETPSELTNYSPFLLYFDDSITQQNDLFADDYTGATNWGISSNARIIPLKTFQAEARDSVGGTLLATITFKKGLKYSSDGRDLFEEGVSLAHRSYTGIFYMTTI